MPATAPRLPALPLLVLALAAACVGPRPDPRPPEELTPGELRELLAGGTIEPVIMDGDDPFAGIDPEMDEPDPSLTEGFDEGANVGAETVEGADPEVGTEPEPPPPIAPVPENPYLVFGERIKVNPDGTITKPYPLRVGTGKKMSDLITKYGNFPLWTDAEGPSPPSAVKLEVLEGWDVELVQDLRNVNAQATAQPLADWLVVTAGHELLYEVEEFINLFGAGVPQIEIEAKIVEISFSDTLDLGVSSTNPMFDFPDHTFVKNLDSSIPNRADGSEGLLSIGGVQDGLAFNAVLEAIATNDNVSIISRPKIAVREGGRADIANTERIPYLKVGQINAAGAVTSSIDYIDIGVQLYVVPRVVGTDTVALNIDVEASQQTGTATVTEINESVVQVPIVARRSAHTIVYLQPGQAVILGGLITERTVENVRKVPILGDIPILRLLFSSTFTSKEETNVLFFIRPRILQGSDLNREF